MSEQEYHYREAHAAWHESYMWPGLLRMLAAEQVAPGPLFDLGCGTGATAAMLRARGFEVTGVDPSPSGIRLANETFPDIRLEPGDAYEDLAARFGRFPVVMSLEVVEHLFAPRAFARTLHALLEDDGLGIVSTPYHGYVKNLAIALLGGWDRHMNPLWDHGHIKQFSRATLTALFEETGFEVVRFARLGRVPPLAKSMMIGIRKRLGEVRE